MATGFVISGGGAAFGNPKFTAQGRAAGAVQSGTVQSGTVIAAAPTAASAPPKANAAPSVSKNAAVGLIDALNAYELTLCTAQPGQTEGTFLIPNTYSVEFAPVALGNSLVTKGGKPNKAKTPMQQSATPGGRLDPNSNSADYNVRTFGYSAGTSVVSILDEIMKNSSFIADQAAYIVDEQTQKTVPQTPLGNLVWYKISVVTTPKGYDAKRLDFAFNIKYVISAYAINSMLSQYFPMGKMRGIHKSYKYWFTGQNTQVLRFEQEFNKAYLTTFTNPSVSIDQREQQARFTRETQGVQYQAASASSSSQGAEGLTNSIGASAADYLYSYADIANINISIVGDPAWLQQGELAYGVNSATFNFNPFNPDGGINFDAEEIIFDFQWNTVSDYAVDTTGLASPVRSGNNNTQIYNYKAKTVISKFSQGKFEQELSGTLIQLYDATSVVDTNANPTDRRLAGGTQAAPLVTEPRILLTSKIVPVLPDVNSTVNADDPESQFLIKPFNNARDA
jgi:hypothetical protein